MIVPVKDRILDLLNVLAIPSSDLGAESGKRIGNGFRIRFRLGISID